MDSTSIIPVNIEDEMRGSYLAYAMSVIIGRALPDVRDGLKPVHRRILFAMHEEGLSSGKKHSKCAGVVGEVLKHYHPHGDSAVYNSLVRMAQEWSLRYPLIDGQGNFGSVDGDSPAAYRYTECRMTALAEALLADIEKDTVDFVPNFDESVEEPLVLPSRVPNLLINGAEGIAVGMASTIPPHNLREVVEGTIRLIKDPEVSTEDLMEIIPGPDFPTAGIIYGAEPLKAVYQTGKGLFQIRAKVHIESHKTGRETIIVDEIPYQVNKAKLIEKIAELVQDKKIDGISKLRDESDRQGMRIVIEVKKDTPTDIVLNQLYAQTAMQRSFGVIMLAIVEGRPRVLGLKDLLQCFVNHRRTVITRRTNFELVKAEARLHVLEGLRIALDNIDEVVKIIRGSESTAEAKTELQNRFQLSEIQAQQILDMPLRRLTGLERKAIDEEHGEVTARVVVYKRILADPKEVDQVAVTELEEIKERFGDERRTVIEEQGAEIDQESLIVEEEMVVSVSHRGYIKRCSPSLYRSQRRGGKGVRGSKKLSEDDGDFITDLFSASTHAYLLVFTSSGKLHWIKVYSLPEMGRTARGRAIVNMLHLGETERVTAILPVRHFSAGQSVMLCTKVGQVKRVDLMAFSNVRRGGIRAMNLDQGDELIAAELTDGKRDCIIATKFGMSIRFAEGQVRVMGRVAGGVRGINLDPGDEVVNLITSPGEGEEGSADGKEEAFLTVCENGYGKRTALTEYRTQGRGGKGVIDIKTNERNGVVIDSCRVTPEDEVMIITSAGQVIRTPVKTISLIGRNTMGVRLINLEEGEKVAAVARLAEREDSETNGGANGSANGSASENADDSCPKES